MIDNDDFYDIADSIFEYIVKNIMNEFRILKNALTSFDELNVFTKVETTYRNLHSICYDSFLELASMQYERVTEDEDYSEDGWLSNWLDELLNDVDEITKYIYDNEHYRKKSRCYESLLLGENVDDSIESSMKQYTRMVHQELINITDKITEKAYNDMGVEKVKWVTEKDGRVCHICESRDNKIYDIDKVPTKPHIGCRCIEVPA